MKKQQWKKINFKDEILEYIDSLSKTESMVFENVYTELIESSKDLCWIYFALELLGNRDIITSQRLFFNKSYCEEVDLMVQSYKEQRDGAALKEMFKDKIDYRYAHMFIPGCSEKTYTRDNAIAFLKGFYGDEEIPEKIIEEANKYPQ